MEARLRHYQFSKYRLEPEHRLLYYENKGIKLTARVFDLLVYLIEQRHRIVSQEELLHQLWDGVSVETANVRVTINRLRMALNDQADPSRWIATIPKKGYRFIAPVKEIRAASSGLVRSSPSNNEILATQYYQKAQRLIELRDQHNFTKGLRFLLQALEINPQYVEALVDAADAHIYLGNFHHEPPDKVYPQAEQYLRRALAINPNLPGALGSLGILTAMHHWNGTEAARLLRKALRLAPHSAMAHYRLGFLGIMLENSPMALKHMHKAVEMEPLYRLANADLAQAYCQAGMCEEAIRRLLLLLKHDEHFAIGHYYSARVYLVMKQYDKALSAAERAVELDPGAEMLALTGSIKARTGKRREARALLQQLQILSTGEFVSPFFPAEIYLSLGDPDQAMPYLHEALRIRSPQLFRLKIDPAFREFHKDRRIASLLRRVRLS